MSKFLRDSIVGNETLAIERCVWGHILDVCFVVVRKFRNLHHVRTLVFLYCLLAKKALNFCSSIPSLLKAVKYIAPYLAEIVMTSAYFFLI